MNSIKNKETVVKKRRKSCHHGMYETTIYKVWYRTVARRNTQGISICDSWRKFENFFNDMGHRPESTFLARKDKTKGLSKDNCHWKLLKKFNKEAS